MNHFFKFTVATCLQLILVTISSAATCSGDTKLIFPGGEESCLSEYPSLARLSLKNVTVAEYSADNSIFSFSLAFGSGCTARGFSWGGPIDGVDKRSLEFCEKSLNEQQKAAPQRFVGGCKCENILSPLGAPGRSLKVVMAKELFEKQFPSKQTPHYTPPPAPVVVAMPASVVTPTPVPIAASTTQPARAAAIANVEVPVTQANTRQLTQVTTNPIDLQKKTSGNEVWISFNPSVTVQERQFCRIVENFRVERGIAEQTRNAIKVNETFKSFIQSLNALLPDGKFQGWVMRTVFVSQARDGSAEVLLELPCNVYVGSNACDANPQNFYGTAPEGSRIYSELAKMTVGDFALTSGTFVNSDDKAFQKSRSVASFRYLKTAAHCRSSEMPADSDFFGLKLDVISTIK